MDESSARAGADEHLIECCSIREQLERELGRMKLELESFQSSSFSGSLSRKLREVKINQYKKHEEGLNEENLESQANYISSVSDQQQKSKPQQQTETLTANNNNNNKMSEREATPTGTMNMNTDPLLTGSSSSGSNRATTTERRTTTTTTTKRTIKSSDDFAPTTATDIQQVRSESRTGSISSTSTPIFSTSGGPISDNLASQQQTTSSTTRTTTSTTSRQQQQDLGGSSTGSQQQAGLSSPLIQDTEEGRVLKLRFDVSQYTPDEIIVKTVDNRLTVHAKHEERSENKTVYQEYNREFHLPDGTDVELIRSSLSKDGLLTVDCPLPTPQHLGASRTIPIEKL